MRRLLPLWVRCRAAIGLVALYALVLQPFLASASVLTMPDAPGVICEAGHADPSAGRDTARHHDGSCCLVAAVGALAAPPDSDAPSVRRPPAVWAKIHRPPETRLAEARPATHAASARGPPRA